MVGRADSAQSHRFTMQRVTAALAVREPDPVSSPARRSAGSAFAGMMVTVISLAAVAAYGVLRPGDDTSWRDGRSVIIERETGARYVYRDGILHPTLNYASALLILGSAQPASAVVSHVALAGVPRGVPLGIPGVPDPLPASGDLLTGVWSLCSRPGSAQSGDPQSTDPLRGGSRPAAGRAESLLVVGAVPDGAAAMAGHAVLSRDPVGDYHLLWRGRRYPVRSPEIVFTAMAWRDKPATPVAPALLNALPLGADLAPMPVSGRGHVSAFAGHLVGEVVKVDSQSGERQFGLVQADGVAAITPVQADLLLADPANRTGAAVTISQAELTAAPRSASLVPAGDTAPPATVPALDAPGEHGGLCASYGSYVDDSGVPALTLAAGRPSAPGEIRTANAGVDWVAVPPGRGAIVDARVSPTDPGGLLGVVSDLGVLFPVPSTTVLATLGYSGVTPHMLPSSLVSLLPRGNALDPDAVTAA